MSIKNLNRIVEGLRTSSVFEQKTTICGVSKHFNCSHQGQQIIVGDDAAAIPFDEQFLLLAAEGISPQLLSSNAYLAGRSAVLANVNDIYAMGGRPLAMVDVIVAGNEIMVDEICRGMKDNAKRYNVPIVGGHTTLIRGDHASVSLAILGKAKKLITSFAARPGDALVMVYSPDGQWLNSYGFWDSTSTKEGPAIVKDLELLTKLSETEMVSAGKDISMAGIAGTALMLAESSGIGLRINLDDIHVPDKISLNDWLLAFFSYGFVLAVSPRNVKKVIQIFKERSLSSTIIGEFKAGSSLVFVDGETSVQLWDWKHQPFTGFQKP